MKNNGRILVWFSCGAASATAAKLAVEKYPNEDLEIIYCDTLAYEHPDNVRFIADVEDWIGRKIKILSSKKYSDIFRRRSPLFHSHHVIKSLTQLNYEYWNTNDKWTQD